MTLKLIWSVRDSIDTANAFHAEIANAERGESVREAETNSAVHNSRWTRFLFGRSRFRRARIYDGMAVGLLLVLMAALGVITWAASAKADPADTSDPVAVAFAAHYGAAVCSTLADYPSVAGLEGIMQAIEQEGLTPRQAGEAAALSVYELCPRYSYILDRFVAIFGPQGVVA